MILRRRPSGGETAGDGAAPLRGASVCGFVLLLGLLLPLALGAPAWSGEDGASPAEGLETESDEPAGADEASHAASPAAPAAEPRASLDGAAEGTAAPLRYSRRTPPRAPPQR